MAQAGSGPNAPRGTFSTVGNESAETKLVDFVMGGSSDISETQTETATLPMKRILTVVGARPQFIKAAPVSRALAADGLTEVIVHTGQHFDALMSDVFFDELDIPKPAHNLEINSLAHGAMTGRMLEKLEATMLA